MSVQCGAGMTSAVGSVGGLPGCECPGNSPRAHECLRQACASYLVFAHVPRGLQEADVIHSSHWEVRPSSALGPAGLLGTGPG